MRIQCGLGWALHSTQTRSTARSSDPDRGRVEAKKSLNPDLQSALDLDPCFRVESHRGSPHRHWKRIHWIRIPDPDLMWSRVRFTRHADYAHCTVWMDLMHCHAVQHSISGRGRVEAKWSLNTDPRYPSDAYPRSRVESPAMYHYVLF